MSTMPFSMVIYLRRFTWHYHWDIRPKGSYYKGLSNMFANYISQSMASDKLLSNGISNSLMPYLIRGFSNPRPIILSLRRAMVALLVYVDDIIIACLNKCIVYEVKAFLHSKFKMKALGSLKYFLGLEIARFTTGVVVCQRQYTL